MRKRSAERGKGERRPYTDLELGERIPGRIARVREIRREGAYVVYVLTDSKHLPEGRPPRERADWRRAA